MARSRVRMARPIWRGSSRVAKPGVDLGAEGFVLGEFALRMGDLVDVPLRQRPDPIVIWNHLSDEAFQFAQRKVVRHYPDADTGAADAGIFGDDGSVGIRGWGNRGYGLF